MSQDLFPYMRWAKAHLNGAWGPRNLGMSGVRPPSLEQREAWGLPPRIEVGASLQMLKEAISDFSGVPEEGVHPTAGTSHANFLVALALARGGVVAVESPSYEALTRLPLAIGAEATVLRRDPLRRWRLDPTALAEAVAAEASLFFVSDLHNPSGQRLHDDDLGLLIEAAEATDGWLLIDEVYQAFDPEPRQSAALRHPRVLTSNSLTKVHGLGDLRCGWVLGAPEVIRRLSGLDDLVHPGQPAAALLAGARYLPHARDWVEPLRRTAAERIGQIDAWVKETEGVSWTAPHGGFTGFLLLDGLDGEALAARVLSDASVRVVPGSFFQHRQAIRISFQLEREELATALAELTKAIVAEKSA